MNARSRAAVMGALLTVTGLPLLASAQLAPLEIFQSHVPGDDVDTETPVRRFFSTDATPLRELNARLAQRLASDEGRKALQAEALASIKQSKADLRRVLGIDATTEQQVFELLAAYMVQQQEQMLARTAARGDAVRQGDVERDEAQRANRHFDQLKAVLGAAGLERYQYYETTRYERGRVAAFEKRLPAAKPLTAQQRQRMLELVSELQLRINRGGGLLGLQRTGEPPWNLLYNRRWREQWAEQRNLEVNEDALYKREEAFDFALARAAQFLQPEQLSAYAQWEVDKLERRRRYISGLRSAAGLSPNIPEPTPDVVAANTPTAGKLQLALHIRINDGQANDVYLPAESGSATSFDLDELHVQAVPTLFADGEAFVILRFFERNRVTELPLGSVGLDAPATVDAHVIVLGGSRYRNVQIELAVRGPTPPREMPTA